MRDKLKDWLSSTVSSTNDGKYRHHVIRENEAKRADVLNDLRFYIQEAHKDVINYIEYLKEPEISGNPPDGSLDPLEELIDDDPLDGYPGNLSMQTLKGYFGEIFAGIVAENFSPFGIDDWKVPVYLFRFHNVAIQHIETINQLGIAAKDQPGRTGDDCLAFQLKEGQIVSILYCEAKCTADHDAAMIKKAHEKVSQPAIVDLFQIVDALKRRKSSGDYEWIRAIQRAWTKSKTYKYERYDLVSYIHGLLPTKKPFWLPQDGPHPGYTGSRRLEAVEIHITEVEELINVLYKQSGVPVT